ncbi:hypothetical protein MSMAC_1383 [Methanosarcina mazei C16]|jgi:hypothetical protein|uniref:Uncharacterized protein n=2 Tax=Methanosarcina mazei TaxID=2209 RepID=A0A0E3RZ04_METMZ|nr:hypothetical protein MSMAL_1467 [Methanosarcina mazei LYC]AKB71273.1 hypothetical protein MSMAC_1383 [Methanosarcina mazei C16]
MKRAADKIDLTPIQTGRKRNDTRDYVRAILEKGLIVKNQGKEFNSLHVIIIIYEVKLYSYSGRFDLLNGRT